MLFTSVAAVAQLDVTRVSSEAIGTYARSVDTAAVFRAAGAVVAVGLVAAYDCGDGALAPAKAKKKIDIH